MDERAGGASLGTVIVFTEDAAGLAAWYREVLDLGPWEEAPRHLGQRVGPVYVGFD